MKEAVALTFPVAGGHVSLWFDETNGFIGFIDSQEGEVVSWERIEWEADPECARAILEAIRIALCEGMDAVRARRQGPLPG